MDQQMKIYEMRKRSEGKDDSAFRYLLMDNWLVSLSVDIL